MSPSIIKKKTGVRTCVWEGGKIIPGKKRNLTVRIRRLTEGEEVHDGIVHLQHGRTLPVHHRQTRPPAHRVVRQTTRKDNEGLPGTHTHTHRNVLM